MPHSGVGLKQMRSLRADGTPAPRAAKGGGEGGEGSEGGEGGEGGEGDAMPAWVSICGGEVDWMVASIT